MQPKFTYPSLGESWVTSAREHEAYTGRDIQLLQPTATIDHAAVASAIRELAAKLSSIERRLERLELQARSSVRELRRLEDAKLRVLRYLEERGGEAYPHEIARDLRMPIPLVLKVMNALREEGIIEEGAQGEESEGGGEPTKPPS
ncbi:MAG: hypothetical protein DRN99_02125 [Thermoproteota archaeon]|nr:MAG: hypothetical protein DRN99_02125 [Candidatus Korarchaeota archaeon]